MTQGTFYTIDYGTVGNFKCSPKQAENVSISEGTEWRGDARVNFSVLKTADGKVYITNELATILAGRSGCSVDATMGRIYLSDFSKNFEDIMRHITYPRRNENEEFVSRRNTKIVEILMNLL